MKWLLLSMGKFCGCGRCATTSSAKNSRGVGYRESGFKTEAWGRVSVLKKMRQLPGESHCR